MRRRVRIASLLIGALISGASVGVGGLPNVGHGPAARRFPVRAAGPPNSSIGRGRRAAVQQNTFEQKLLQLRDFNRQGARGVDPTGWRRG